MATNPTEEGGTATEEDKQVADAPIDNTPEDELEKDQFYRAGSARGARFEIAKDPETGMLFWMYYAQNGQPVATGPEGYERLGDLKNTISSMREYLPEAKIVKLY